MFIFKNSKRDHYLRKRYKYAKKSDEGRENKKKVLEFIKEFEEALTDAFLFAMLQSGNDIEEKAVRDLMEEGGVIDEESLQPEQYGGIKDHMETVFQSDEVKSVYDAGAQQGIELVHTDIPTARIPVEEQPYDSSDTLDDPMRRFSNIFDYTSAYERWTREHTGELIVQIDNIQRENVKQIINDCLNNNRSYQTAADEIRRHIGLTSRLSAAVTRYQNRYLSMLMKENPGMSISEAYRRATAAADKYADGLRRYRANNIARTELARAQMGAALEYIKWGQRHGFFGAMYGKWVTSGKDNVCTECIELSGCIVDLEHDPLPPLHPQCACAIRFIEGEAESTMPDKYKDVPVENLGAAAQWERYKTVLGEGNVPKTLDSWQKMKYNDSDKYRDIREKYTDKKLQSRIRSDYNLTIHEGRQGKHIIGHNNYIEGRSYITVSLDEAQKLVDKYAGTGLINRSQTTKKWLKTETITVENIIGVDIDNRSGIKTNTNTFKIHYSKNGTHIVPQKR